MCGKPGQILQRAGVGEYIKIAPVKLFDDGGCRVDQRCLLGGEVALSQHFGGDGRCDDMVDAVEQRLFDGLDVRMMEHTPHFDFFVKSMRVSDDVNGFDPGLPQDRFECLARVENAEGPGGVIVHELDDVVDALVILILGGQNIEPGLFRVIFSIGRPAVQYLDGGHGTWLHAAVDAVFGFEPGESLLGFLQFDGPPALLALVADAAVDADTQRFDGIMKGLPLVEDGAVRDAHVEHKAFLDGGRVRGREATNGTLVHVGSSFQEMSLPSTVSGRQTSWIFQSQSSWLRLVQ